MATLDADDWANMATLLLSSGVRLADSVTHGGAAALLQLMKLSAINPNGNAIEAESLSNGHGIRSKGSLFFTTGSIESIISYNPNTRIVSTAHGLSTAMFITITGSTGNTLINGLWQITVIDEDNFYIGFNSSSGGIYTGGGIWTHTINNGSGLALISEPGVPALSLSGGIFIDVSNSESNGIRILTDTGTAFYIEGQGDGFAISVAGSAFNLSADTCFYLFGTTNSFYIQGATYINDNINYNQSITYNGDINYDTVNYNSINYNNDIIYNSSINYNGETIYNNDITYNGSINYYEPINYNEAINILNHIYGDLSDPGSPSNHLTLDQIMMAMYRMLWKKRTMDESETKTYADDEETVNSIALNSDVDGLQTLGAFKDPTP